MTSCTMAWASPRYLFLLSSFVFMATAFSEKNDLARKPKLFYVSSSTTTSTLSTTAVCFVTTAAGATTCSGKRKRRMIKVDSETDAVVLPSRASAENDGGESLNSAESVEPLEDSAGSDLVSGGREGRFFLYWLTTTTTSSSTSITLTYSISSAACTPLGASICAGR